MITSRPYVGVADLERMLGLASDCFADTDVRVGDVAWATREHSHRELSLYVRLWENGGELVGWTWSEPSGWLEPFLVRPDHRRPATYGPMLDAFEDSCAAGEALGDPVVPRRIQVGARDEVLRAVLLERGFARQDWGFDIHRIDADQAAPPAPPPGYRLEGVTEQTQVGRVEAHRAAFAPSAMTLEKLQRLARLRAYSPALDRIAVDSDGTVVAACTGWLDRPNRAGLLEPVGTLPAHRTRGLARAVCLDAVRCLHEAGARQVQVLGLTGSVAAGLYRSIGGVRVGTVEVYSRTP